MSPLHPNLSAPSLFSASGLNILVTGGGGNGLGAIMTRALALNGANKVFILGRRKEALDETVKSCEELVKGLKAGTVVQIQADVTKKEDLERAYEIVKGEVEYLDVIVANSGVIGPPSFPSPLSTSTPLAELRDHWFSTPPTEFTSTLSINITGVWYTILAFLPFLQRANELRPQPSELPRPQVICVTSIAAYQRTANAGWAYSASKAGAEHLMKSLGTRLTGEGIRSNCIAPGPFYSEMSNASALYSNCQSSRGVIEGDIDKSDIPLGRAGSEEDIAGAILYLCSPAGAFLSGNTILLDGGRTGSLPSW